MIEFQGCSYYDDRIFVLYLCKGAINVKSDNLIETTIYHEEPSNNSHWCLVTYRNYANYPLHSVKIFDTTDEAVDYVKAIEPTTPLISLEGHSPRQLLIYEEYVKWKKEKLLEEYNYQKVYLPGGSNNREVALQTKEQFLESNPNWPHI